MQAKGEMPKFVKVMFLLAAVVLSVMFIWQYAVRPALAGEIDVTKIGFVTDTATLLDRGWNWTIYQGLLRAETELGINGTVYTSTSSDDYESNLAQCVADGNDLCIAAGFLLLDATASAATVYSTTNFMILDTATAVYSDNLRSALMPVNEAAYLAGILAGAMSESKVVGDIAGMQIPPVDAFVLPFEYAVQCVSPGATVLLTYTNDFDNPDLGATVAQTFMAQGADVIFSPAGQTAVGAILTATQSGAWGIGVDTDAYAGIFNDGSVAGAGKLLTSVLKKIDNAVYYTIEDVVQGSFTGGEVIYDLADNGVGLAPYHEADAFVPGHIRAYIDWVKRDILAGKIDVNSPACAYSFNVGYLPFLSK